MPRIFIPGLCSKVGILVQGTHSSIRLSARKLLLRLLTGVASSASEMTFIPEGSK